MPRSYRRLTPFFTLLLAVAAADQVQAAACLDCHPAVAAQLQANSHHIQGVAADGRHCYACHWEADAAGAVDERYHRRDGRIDLVLWSAARRPNAYQPGTSAISYTSAAIGTDRERPAVAAISRHCLSCHDDATSTVAPFAGDTNRPGRFAWDGTSIAARYGDTGVTTWGKYSTATSNKKKQVVKAFSAHGNSSANAGGWSPVSGYDGAMPNTRGRASAARVECYDCHNAHGSAISGITASYPGSDGAFRGGLLKQTTAGLGGYRSGYAPTALADKQGGAAYNPGAGLCFDCHETATPGTTPWGYAATFGASEPIMGYKDTHRFGPGIKGSTSRYSSRQGRREIISNHLKSGAMLRYSTSGAINGLCTPCHDPHGVSPTLGENRAYAVPLLKGTWLTSPYREDVPPTAAPEKDRQGGFSGSARGPVSAPGMKYNIDRTTFGPNGRITENTAAFAGLCLRCHPGIKPSGESTTARIHRAVKGWGDNREHAFPCSKCHQTHNSGLPRLMQTNCFQSGPPGVRNNFDRSWLPETRSAANGGYRPGVNQRSRRGGTMVGCHVRQFGWSDENR